MQLQSERPDLKRQYEQKVASNDQLGFFEQAWVQDCLHPTWKYVVNEQGHILLRVPYKNKWGLKAYLQPLFIRALHVFSAPQSDVIVGALRQKLFLHINLDNPSISNSNFGIFQKLTWKEGIDEIRSGYSTNVISNSF